jgi:hypothetical protein
MFFWYSRISRHLYSFIFYVGLKDKASNYRYKLTIERRDATGSVCQLTSWYLNNVEEIRIGTVQSLILDSWRSVL